MGSRLVSRRSALGMAAVSAAGIALVGGSGRGPDEAHASESPRASGSSGQYGFMVRVENCVNCGKCVEVCRKHSKTPKEAPARRHVSAYVDAWGRNVYVSTSCMHCEDPACMKVCPAGALSKGAGGLVTVDKDRCIGCKYCFQACPYEAPHYTDAGMDKCDCCLENGIPLGEEPWCVQKCRFGALEYGLLEDLMAETNGKAKRLESTTGPALLLR